MKLHRTVFSVAILSALTTSFATAQNRFEPDGKDHVDRSISRLYGPAFSDIDADGDLDVVAAGRIVENYLGRFSERTGFENVGGILAVADFNGDGRPDLIDDYRDPRVVLNQLPFSMQPTPLPIGSLYIPNNPGLAIADFDNDGDLDIVLTPRTSLSDLGYFQNDGQGNFTSLAGIAFPPTLGIVRAQDAWPIDIDSDGDLDLMVEDDRSTQGFTVFTNQGNGTFGPPDASVFSTPFNLIRGWHDFNRDGLDDLVVDDGRVLLRQGTDFVPSQVAYLQTNTNLVKVVSGDIDNDGDIDLWAEYSSNARPRWFENVAAGSPYINRVNNVPDVRRAAGEVALSDLDGDGWLDVIALDSRVRVFRGQPGGVFHDLTPSRPTSGMFGDFNGDGLQDRIYSRGFFRWFVQLADGTGGFAERDATPGVTVLDMLGNVDLDGDGDLDALVGINWPFPSLGVMLNDGTGLFQDLPGGAPIGLTDPEFAKFSDLDGDGDLDAAVYATPQSSRVIHILINDGTGRFSRPGASQIVGLNASDKNFALADVDGDNVADLIVGETDARLFRNDGSARFTEDTTAIPPRSPGNFWPPRSLVTGDYDQDGDEDLLIVWYQGVPERVSLLANDGTGSFTLQAPLSPNSDDWHIADMLDVDLDGSLDIAAVVNEYSPERFQGVRVFYNDGAGNLAESSDPFDAPFSAATGSFQDVDGDGDPDFVAYDGLMINHTRQLRARFTPRIGLSLILEVGHMENAFVHLSGAKVSPVPVPGIGVAVVDPVGTTAFFRSFRGPERFTWTIPVPNDPSLAGSEVFAQALDATPGSPRLTNAIREVILY